MRGVIKRTDHLTLREEETYVYTYLKGYYGENVDQLFSQVIKGRTRIMGLGCCRKNVSLTLGNTLGRRAIRTMYDALKGGWVGFPSLNLFKCKSRHQPEVTDLIVS